MRDRSAATMVLRHCTPAVLTTGSDRCAVRVGRGRAAPDDRVVTADDGSMAEREWSSAGRRAGAVSDDAAFSSLTAPLLSLIEEPSVLVAVEVEPVAENTLVVAPASGDSSAVLDDDDTLVRGGRGLI